MPRGAQCPCGPVALNDPAALQPPPLAGQYLAERLNSGVDCSNNGVAGDGDRPFNFSYMGSMAQIGGSSAVVDTPDTALGRTPKVSGFAAFLAWRGVYWSKQLSWRNRALLAFSWVRSGLFGRDISRF